MTNRIDALVEFSFKGETYTPSATIDLDAAMDADGRLPDLHRAIALANGIDTYSYLYEVMESHDIAFANAVGTAAEFLVDGHFDSAAFEQRWQTEQKLAVLRPIAKRHLAIDTLEQHSDVMAALLDAYDAGCIRRQ